MLRKSYLKLPLRGKILLPLLSVFLGMWILGTLGFGYFVTNRLEKHMQEDIRDVSSVVLHAFEQEKELLLLKARLVAEREDVSRMVAEGNTEQLFLTLLPLQASFRLDLLQIIDNNGSVVLKLKQEAIAQVQLHDDLVNRIARLGIDWFDFVAAEENSPSLLVGLTSVKSSHKILGGVIVGTAISEEFLTKIRTRKNQHLVAFYDSQIMASTLAKAKRVSWQPPPVGSPPVRVVIGEESYIAKTLELGNTNNAGGKLVLLKPFAPLDQAQQQLWASISFFCLQGALITTIVGVRVTGWLTSRIFDLTWATQELANGDLNTRISVSGKDEVVILAQTFNLMAEQLAERDKKISLQVQQLEQTLQQLKAAHKQIIAQEKLASMGSLTTGIAHEIRNPLNLINGLADVSLDLTQELIAEIENQLAQLDAQEVDYIKELVTELRENAIQIHQQGQRTEGIIQGMLMHARHGSGQRELADINALLDKAMHLSYRGMQVTDNSFHVDIESDYDQSIGSVAIVPQDISRALLNIINNAFYSVQEKKKAIGKEFTPLLTVSTKNLGNKVEISIRDNGEGVSPDVIDNIFHAFFTTKPPGKGTGLGLSFTHDIIVGQHQGEIKLETELGKYAEFILTFPKSASDYH
ncbi:MAG: HAMP domain-containing protein [Symploca sp. SIO2E9]|nr:HAMP domain-containing protein [Symploca sp. SIO2E9]